MSDPIDNILANLVQYIPTNKGYYMANGDKITFDETVKQIRQQIGRELLDRKLIMKDVVTVGAIREVCKLEKDND